MNESKQSHDRHSLTSNKRGLWREGIPIPPKNFQNVKRIFIQYVWPLPQMFTPRDVGSEQWFHYISSLPLLLRCLGMVFLRLGFLWAKSGWIGFEPHRRVRPCLSPSHGDVTYRGDTPPLPGSAKYCLAQQRQNRHRHRRHQQTTQNLLVDEITWNLFPLITVTWTSTTKTNHLFSTIVWNHLYCSKFSITIKSIFNLESWLQKRETLKSFKLREMQKTEKLLWQGTERAKASLSIIQTEDAAMQCPNCLEARGRPTKHIAQRLKPKQVGGKELLHFFTLLFSFESLQVKKIDRAHSELTSTHPEKKDRCTFFLWQIQLQILTRSTCVIDAVCFEECFNCFLRIKVFKKQ